MIENRHIRRKAVRERACATAVGQPHHSRVLFVLLAVVALAIQILVVQTHIHIPQASGRSTSVSIVTVAQHLISGAAVEMTDRQSSIPRDKYPINEDPSNCPLCQEIAHSGQFVQSAAVLAYVPVWVSVHFIVFNEVLPSFLTVSHNWQGRAPPQN
jgi:hypothetical protein